MKTLEITELLNVAGGHNNNHHNNNNNHNDNHHNNDHNNNHVQNPPHNDPADGINKLNIIQNGLANGDSWATIGKNIQQYFSDKYGFVDKYGR